VRNLAAIFLLLLVGGRSCGRPTAVRHGERHRGRQRRPILPGVTVVLSGPTCRAADRGSRTPTPLPLLAGAPRRGFIIKFELSGFNTIEQTGLVVNIGKDTALASRDVALTVRET